MLTQADSPNNYVLFRYLGVSLWLRETQYHRAFPLTPANETLGNGDKEIIETIQEVDTCSRVTEFTFTLVLRSAEKPVPPAWHLSFASIGDGLFR